LVWVPDQSRSVTIIAAGEGFASIEVYAPSSATAGSGVTVYCDLTNTGNMPDTFMVSFEVDGAITNYDVNNRQPVNPGETAPRLSHTFTMPTHDVTVRVTGHHWEEAAAAGLVSPVARAASRPGAFKGLRRFALEIPILPSWTADILTLGAITAPILFIGSTIAASKMRP